MSSFIFPESLKAVTADLQVSNYCLLGFQSNIDNCKYLYLCLSAWSVGEI